jgi:hypothetical protein
VEQTQRFWRLEWLKEVGNTRAGMQDLGLRVPAVLRPLVLEIMWLLEQ